ncbi:MAG TPA: sigma-70 family RNA polymerase sigma factor [Anaerolineae bacterium]|nr:sigma-70 family RNA polymerase sigma factor [Anaerolineae bacterium]
MPLQFSQPSEEDLIVRAVQGDTAAFGDLYERYLALIYRYVFYRVNDVAEAEDLTEQVFLKAWEALGHYQLRDVPFSAWLYRIAHNVVADRYRTHKETLPLEGQLLLCDVASSPEDRLDWRETIEAVAYALSQLTPIHQQVLTLRFISGLSHAETARVLERSEEAVRVLQHRALATLRELLTKSVRSDDERYGADFS